MFVRTKVVRRGQKEYQYLQLVENQRENGRVQQKVLLSLGRIDTLDKAQVDSLVTAFTNYTQQAQVLG